MIYLLLFQRDVIERYLTTSAVSGRDYLEKIVQAVFDMPQLEQDRVENILFTRLDQLLGDQTGSESGFDRQRWGNLFLGGLRPYLINLRAVNRFLGTLSIGLGLFRGVRVFEVNCIDFLALEVLRVFEPEAYAAIRNEKTLLTAFRSSDRDGDSEQRRIRHIYEIASNRQAVECILRELFPTANWAFEFGSTYGPEWGEIWAKSKRVCSAAFFDRYFAFSIPSGDISASEIDEIRSLAGDRKGLAKKLADLQDQGKLDVALNRLEDYKADIAISAALSFVPAILDIGDTLSRDRGFYGISPYMHAFRIVIWYLRQEDNLERRGQLMLDAIRLSSSLALSASLVSFAEESVNKQQASQHGAIIEENQLQAAKMLMLGKFSGLAEQKPSQLLTDTHLAHILFRWKEWDDSGGAETFVRSMCKAPDTLAGLLCAFTKKVTVQGEGDYVTTQHWRADLKALEHFCTIEDFTETLGKADKASLDPEDLRAVEAFERTLDRRRQGKHDDPFFDLDDED